MKIKIKNYPVFVGLGISEQERREKQEVLVTVEVNLQGNFQLLQSDSKVEETVDYVKILKTIDTVICSKSWTLVEAVVIELASKMIDQFSLVSSGIVKVVKPKLPGGIAKGAKISVSRTFERKDLF